MYPGIIEDYFRMDELREKILSKKSNWFCRKVPAGFEATKGIVNGIILGLISWGLIWLCYFAYITLK